MHNGYPYWNCYHHPALIHEKCLLFLKLRLNSWPHFSFRSKIPNTIHLNKHHRLMFSRLPYYIMALHATCQNSSNFHGVDLINTLTNHMRRFRKDGLNDYFQHALSIQALCSTGHPVKWRFIEDLLNGQRQDGCFHKPCPGSCENERIGKNKNWDDIDLDR